MASYRGSCAVLCTYVPMYLNSHDGTRLANISIIIARRDSKSYRDLIREVSAFLQFCILLLLFAFDEDKLNCVSLDDQIIKSSKLFASVSWP